MNTKNSLLRIAGLIGVCSILALSANHYFSNKPYWAYTTMDFSAQTAGHLQWPTWTTPSGSAGTKYAPLELASKSGGAGQCYSIHMDNLDLHPQYFRL